ncbi:probable G-protein coupled receptor Mth-like 5 isoform X1 [Drosophila tropicalis]|uniref:probable G-protein coupled receptor Mth-like 5 isoform X1 n=1 Tax=Drosophila tropicalis TaxID=46794 RepID=UPI0035AC2068
MLVIKTKTLGARFSNSSSKAKLAQCAKSRSSCSVCSVWCIVLTLLLCCCGPTAAHLGNSVGSPSSSVDPNNLVRVNKCCEKFEIQVENACQLVNETDQFQPKFVSLDGKDIANVQYKFVIGLPNCGSLQIWDIYDNGKDDSSDRLQLLDNGKLRHYTRTLSNVEGEISETKYDLEPGQYCLDKVEAKNHSKEILFAKICVPKALEMEWDDWHFVLMKILDPIFHIISLIILLVIAIVYFILPTLSRDLVGNIVTTIAMCLMISQASDLVRIFTMFSSHVSFIVADIILSSSQLAAFVWLNSFGFYIWKTFRSRNVFLRVTDGRKYCYYSAYAWSCAGIMAALAVFAHFFLDVDLYKQEHMVAEQQTIGLLAMCIFFAPIACTILINIFFFVTTSKLINRRTVYGRIAHKLKANFIMFSLMFLVMSVVWLFHLMTWLELDGLMYAYIIVNALQAPLLLYICVLRQRHVTFLLRKTCCYNEPPSANDWGDELHYMNGNDY